MAGILGCGCCCGDDKDETDGKRGRPLSYDPNFKGPIRGKARRPKDILCLFLFLIFIAVFLAIGVFSFVHGEPRRIVYPTDSKGRLCGVDAAVKNKPYLLFFDLTRCATIVSVKELIAGEFDASALFTCPTPQVCVKECPLKNELGVRNMPVCVDEVTDIARFDNITNVDPANLLNAADNVAALLNLIRQEKCAPYYILSAPVARRCVPTVIDIVQQAESVFNFTSNTSLLDLVDRSNITAKDLFLNLDLQSIVDGSFSQRLLVAFRQFLLDVYQDLVVVWPALLIGLGVAMMLSFVYIVLLRCIAGPIIWLGIILALLFLTAISVFAFIQFSCFQNIEGLASRFAILNTTLTSFANNTNIVEISRTICASTSVVRELIDSQLPWFRYQEYTWLAIGILAAVILLILIIMLIFLGRKIAISIAIINEASKAVGGVPTSVFYPLVTWILITIVLVYWGIVAVFLVTASERTYAIIMNASASESDRNITGLGVVTNGTPCMPTTFNGTKFVDDPNGEYSTAISCQFDQFVTSNFLLGIQIYNFFGMLWLANFVLALGEVTLAGAFASWYWAFRKPKDVPFFALIQSFGRAILFHAGSIAFGSLIIAIIQLVRAILGYVQKKLKGKTGKCTQVLLCMLQCCLWCFEKILRYINRQAYVEIAIYGYDFCTAACKAVKLLIRNILTTAVKDRIVALLLFLGKLTITSIVGVLAYLGLGSFLDLGTRLWGRPLNYFLIPVIFLVITTYLVASGFMSVYHMAVDTIFICAMEDLERNNGRDKPYFMSKQLMKLLNVRNVRSKDHHDGDTIDMEEVQSVK